MLSRSFRAALEAGAFSNKMHKNTHQMHQNSSTIPLFSQNFSLFFMLQSYRHNLFTICLHLFTIKIHGSPPFFRIRHLRPGACANLAYFLYYSIICFFFYYSLTSFSVEACKKPVPNRHGPFAIYVGLTAGAISQKSNQSFFFATKATPRIATRATTGAATMLPQALSSLGASVV